MLKGSDARFVVGRATLTPQAFIDLFAQNNPPAIVLLKNLPRVTAGIMDRTFAGSLLLALQEAVTLHLNHTNNDIAALAKRAHDKLAEELTAQQASSAPAPKSMQFEAVAGGSNGQISVGQAVGWCDKAGRAANQDAMLIARTLDGAEELLVLCDGAGRQQNGEKASETGVNVTYENYRQGKTLREAIKAANAQVCADRQSDKGRKRASTIAAVVITGQTAKIVHAGDSRVYKISAPGQVELLTQDHVSDWEAFFMLKKQAAPQPPISGAALAEIENDLPQYKLAPILCNILSRGLGMENDIALDESEINLADGDWLLLCSDGLTDAIPDLSVKLAALRQQGKSKEEAVASLRSIAQANNPKDNITIIIRQQGADPISQASAATPEDNLSLKTPPEAAATLPRLIRDFRLRRQVLDVQLRAIAKHCHFVHLHDQIQLVLAQIKLDKDNPSEQEAQYLEILRRPEIEIAAKRGLLQELAAGRLVIINEPLHDQLTHVLANLTAMPELAVLVQAVFLRQFIPEGASVDPTAGASPAFVYLHPLKVRWLADAAAVRPAIAALRARLGLWPDVTAAELRADTGIGRVDAGLLAVATLLDEINRARDQLNSFLSDSDDDKIRVYRSYLEGLLLDLAAAIKAGSQALVTAHQQFQYGFLKPAQERLAAAKEFLENLQEK